MPSLILNSQKSYRNIKSNIYTEMRPINTIKKKKQKKKKKNLNSIFPSLSTPQLHNGSHCSQHPSTFQLSCLSSVVPKGSTFTLDSLVLYSLPRRIKHVLSHNQFLVFIKYKPSVSRQIGHKDGKGNKNNMGGKEKRKKSREKMDKTDMICTFLFFFFIDK